MTIYENLLRAKATTDTALIWKVSLTNHIRGYGSSTGENTPRPDIRDCLISSFDLWAKNLNRKNNDKQKNLTFLNIARKTESSFFEGTRAFLALIKLTNLWMKIRLFVARVESILLYGSETWTLTESLKKQIYG